ncbi:MAG TPA: FGGY-family carbohydrate kinase [Candidatus Atribacteria bacterium]|jgi:FGGY-family pentulose kinase|nr:FGGY-family carbohydrate kinase [Atribacterota bacterium]HPT63123.1 FGGY-family carbohydrate kinase [Candidatus Atribacteria bacterium]HPZ40099.1 FGGY-family carbohydrate kinase [Candidatus Atribacteria bacterium]
MPNAKPPYFLGIDVGTQGLRSGIFDARGNVVALSFYSYPEHHPRPGWAEQDPADWWKAIQDTVRRCVIQGEVQPEEIAALSVSASSCTVLPVDQFGNPKHRAIMWMDVRAFEQAERINATHNPVLRYAGGSESPEWMIPKALWLKENLPDVFANSDYLVECQNWIVFKLTDRWVTSLNNAICKWNYCPPEGGWPVSLLRELNFEELLDKWPRDLIPVGERVGELTKRAASDLGLIPGIPVIQGGIDAYAAMVGLDVVHPHRLAMVIGSSTCHLALSDSPIFSTGIWGPYQGAVLPDMWILEGGQSSTGSIIKWFRDNFLQEEFREREELENIFDAMDRMAAQISPGSDGLLVLDNFQGNRSPYQDPLARGAIWGLSLSHTRAHILRAIYEGTAYGTFHILETLARDGFQAEEIYVSGGGARSKLWLQIHADVADIPIYLTTVEEASTLGTAIYAAVGVGFYGSIPEATLKMVQISGQIYPCQQNREIYHFYYEQYVKSYWQLRDLMHRVSTRLGTTPEA